MNTTRTRIRHVDDDDDDDDDDDGNICRRKR